MAIKTCFICSSTDWIDVDHLRSEPANMIVCKGCGFVTFKRFHDDIDYESYYDKDYRTSNVVNASNLITTNRKIGYHEKFLGPWFVEKLKEMDGKNGAGKKLVVGEIGCGIGYFLRWARDKFGAEVAGSELTTSFRRYADHAFGIKVTKDFDYSKQYDLIGCYHTIEHVPDPRQMLLDLHKCLSPGGILYLATPIWMDELMKWGGGSFTTFDDHFHKDHINAWSKWHFESLLEMTGWKIVKENRQFYGWTMLCVPGEVKALSVAPVSSDQVVMQLTDMQRAATAYKKGQFNEAIRFYPRFVDAYLAEVGSNPKEIDKQLAILDIGEKNCPNTRLFNAQRGLILYQYNRLDEAEKHLAMTLDVKPHDDNVLLHVGMIYLKRGEALIKKDYNKGREAWKIAVSIFDKIISINPALYGQCFDYIAYIFSVCPMEDEIKNTERVFEAPHAEGAPHIDMQKETV